jgi:hypothetical protein
MASHESTSRPTPPQQVDRSLQLGIVKRCARHPLGGGWGASVRGCRRSLARWPPAEEHRPVPFGRDPPKRRPLSPGPPSADLTPFHRDPFPPNHLFHGLVINFPVAAPPTTEIAVPPRMINRFSGHRLPGPSWTMTPRPNVVKVAPTVTPIQSRRRASSQRSSNAAPKPIKK